MHRLRVAAIVLAVAFGTGCDSAPTSPSIAGDEGYVLGELLNDRSH